MSFASSSTSAASSLRSSVRPKQSPARTLRTSPCGSRTKPFRAPARHYTPATALAEPEPPEIPSSSSLDPTSTTPLSAQDYLSNLLHLDPSRAFPPALALQILTHKSYRFVNLIRHPRPGDPSPMETSEWAASHNARLSFLGRRALASYLAMFVHSSIASSAELKNLDFLRGRSLENKLEAMRVTLNIGREVGNKWRIGDVMRWDRNETGAESGAAKIKGMAVEAILGGVFTQFGSPAAHRAFHLHVLPNLARQLRDPMLIERVDEMRIRVEGEFGGGILAPR